MPTITEAPAPAINREQAEYMELCFTEWTGNDAPDLGPTLVATPEPTSTKALKNSAKWFSPRGWEQLPKDVLLKNKSNRFENK